MFSIGSMLRVWRPPGMRRRCLQSIRRAASPPPVRTPVRAPGDRGRSSSSSRRRQALAALFLCLREVTWCACAHWVKTVGWEKPSWSAFEERELRLLRLKHIPPPSFQTSMPQTICYPVFDAMWDVPTLIFETVPESHLLPTTPVHSASLSPSQRSHSAVVVIFPRWHVSLVLHAHWVDFCTLWLVFADCKVNYLSAAQQDAKVTAPWMQLQELRSESLPKPQGAAREGSTWTSLSDEAILKVTVTVKCNAVGGFSWFHLIVCSWSDCRFTQRRKREQRPFESMAKCPDHLF